jgi:gliding motility-associated lipoprotein GldH
MIRFSKFHLVFVISIVSLVSISCGNHPVFEQKQNFENASWNMKDTATFNVEVSEIHYPYDIFITIENTKEYTTSNIWLEISVLSPTSAFQKERVEFYLTDEKGRWLGNVSRYTVQNMFLYKSAIRFPKQGKYTFKITQLMRENDSPKVNSVGLVLQKTENSDKKTK